MARIAAVVVSLAIAGVLATAISAPAEATSPAAMTEAPLAGWPGARPETVTGAAPGAVTEAVTEAGPEAGTDARASSELAAARTKNAQTKSKAGETKAKAKAKRGAHRASDDPYLRHPDDAEATPAYRYAQLSQAQCETELRARRIDFVRETARGVLAPIRMTGPLHGVVFRSRARDKVRATSPYEIVDCRLVLALDDFAAILSRHDIVEVRHYSMYRPPKSLPDGEIAKRHPGALAIDTGKFYDRSGGELDVDRDFHGAIGAPTCGEGAGPDPATEAALALRAILCEAVEARIFTVVLTPNYNRPHKNHFHLEITAGVTWFLVH